MIPRYALNPDGTHARDGRVFIRTCLAVDSQPRPSTANRMRIPVLTTLALIAFAANSLLCRLALRSQAIDPATFSAVRIVSGALILGLLVRWPSDAPPVSGGSSWTSAGLLFLYAAPFSFAYLHLSAGTGALLLFASVQVTMVLAALVRGASPSHPMGRADRWL